MIKTEIGFALMGPTLGVFAVSTATRTSFIDHAMAEKDAANAKIIKVVMSYHKKLN